MHDLLGDLRRATNGRFPNQPDALDLLPEVDVDLDGLKSATVRPKGPRPKAPRADFRIQLMKLESDLAGRPQLLLLHALAISYLRRRTPHTAKASAIFHRLWAEESHFLRARLPVRWKISALQTFHDHGCSESQKMVGAVGFIMMNLIKAYESERSMSCADDSRDDVEGRLRPYGFPELGGFTPGDDLLRNINVMALAVARQDPVAGTILKDLLQILARQQTIFQRIDALAKDPPYRDRPEFYRSFGAMAHETDGTRGPK